MKKRLVVGIIRTSHGVKGELKVKSFSGETNHFLKLKEINLKKENVYYQFKVERIREIAGDVLLKLRGIDTPEEGKKYIGSEIWVERSKACPLSDGEYYYADLCQCVVIEEAKEIGHVRSILETSKQDILEVIDLNGKTRMIPFSEEYVGEVNIKDQKIYLKRDAIIY